MKEVTSVATVKVPRVRKGRSEPSAIGGGLEGADRFSRELALWQPTMRAPDALINTVKENADARGRDSVRNDGYVAGAAALHKDGIVGSQYRLNAQPDTELLNAIFGNDKFTEEWADDYQRVVEARWNGFAESEAGWLDASRVNTFTNMVRLAVAVFMATGETLATVEWIRESARPYNTAIQFIRSDRLCNPQGTADTRFLRRGIVRDLRGKALSYYIRKGERNDPYNDDFSYTWVNAPVEKPWGRKQVIHIIEQADHDQSRGVADMVSIMKNIRMTKRFREIVLQNAVVNATYAAAIESELPPDLIQAMIGSAGSPGQGMAAAYGGFMTMLQSFMGGANNIAVDGAVIPTLFPNTKMKLQNAGTPGGVGTSFEESLLRHTAAGLGVSYEALSRDFSKTNYSSGRLAMGVQAQAMGARKRIVADRFANMVYACWLEEAMGDGDVPLPPGVRRDAFYKPLAKEAFCQATWIGSGMGQIDELKETQAAILRMRSGMTTMEWETSRLGMDWRRNALQRSREMKLFEKLGLTNLYDANKPIEKLADVGAGTDGSEDPAADDTIPGDSKGSN